jgi:hypothetical protein
MTYAIPVVDLERVDLQAVRAGTQDLGAIQADYLGAYGRPEQIAAWRTGSRTWPNWPRTRRDGSDV